MFCLKSTQAHHVLQAQTNSNFQYYDDIDSELRDPEREIVCSCLTAIGTRDFYSIFPFVCAIFALWIIDEARIISNEMEIRCLESHVTQVLGVVVVAAEISGPVKFAVRIVRSDCEQFDKIAFTFEMFDQYI